MKRKYSSIVIQVFNKENDMCLYFIERDVRTYRKNKRLGFDDESPLQDPEGMVLMCHVMCHILCHILCCVM